LPANKLAQLRGRVRGKVRARIEKLKAARGKNQGKV